LMGFCSDEGYTNICMLSADAGFFCSTLKRSCYAPLPKWVTLTVTTPTTALSSRM